MKNKVFLKFTDEMLKMAEYEKPEIDELKNEIFSYVNELKNSDIPDKNKQVHLKEFTDNKLSIFFNEYKSRYRQNDEIIENIENKIKYDTSSLKDLEEKIKSKKNEIEYLQQEKEVIENEKNNLLSYKGEKPTLYEKFTLIFFLLIAIGLAILSAYEFSITLNKIEALSENKDIANTHISVFKFILFMFGSFSILIASKAISLIYEKFNYSRKFFIIIVSLSILLAFSSALLLSFDKAFLSERGNLINKITTIQKQIDKINEQAALTGQNLNDFPQVKNLKKELKELNIKLEKYNKKAIMLYMLVTILILISEIFAGATAWSYISEYDKKYSKYNRSQKKLENKLKDIENDEKEAKKILEKLEKEYIDLKTEIHRLNLVLSKIKTEEEIENIIQNYKNSIYQEALTKLLKKEK